MNDTEKETKEYSIRINRILDLISSFGLEVERNAISPSLYHNIRKYYIDYNKYLKYDLPELNKQTFHIREIKDWVFNIELLNPEKPYDPEAIIWGMWIPGITKYKFTETPYSIKLRIDPYGKENNHFWENDTKLKQMFIHIIKNKYVSHYYSYIGKYSLFGDIDKYVTPKQAKRYLNKTIKKQQRINKQRTHIKNLIVKWSIPLRTILKHIDVEEIIIKEYDNTFNIDILVNNITDKYKNILETIAYRNKINLKITIKGVVKEDEE